MDAGYKLGQIAALIDKWENLAETANNEMMLIMLAELKEITEYEQISKPG